MAADQGKYTPAFHGGVLPTVQRQHSSSGTGKPSGGSIQIRVDSEIVTALGQPTTLECQVVQWSEGRTLEEWLHCGRKCEGEKYLKLGDGEWRYLYIKETCLEDEGTYQVVVEEDGVRAENTIKVRVAQPILQTGDSSTCVAVKDFPKYVNKLCSSEDAVYNEFFRVELQWDVTQHSANLNCNAHKNRYCNVFPYDHSRVVLSLRDNVPGSDYINATHIKDSVSGASYIASQGPLAHTYGDFWRMVWEQDVHVMAMVTKSSHHFGHKEKSYCPEAIGDTLTFNSAVVTLTGLEETRHWIRRCMNISYTSGDIGSGASSREVTHFQFLSWPEYGVPKKPTDLLTFREKVVECYSQESGPLLVHCSAGVGRTGSFISVDILARRLSQRKEVDVFSLVRELRLARERTVETPEQYILVHKALAELIHQS